MYDFANRVERTFPDAVKYIDLCQQLGNPLDSNERVFKGCDGTNESTIVAVYSQPNFPGVVNRYADEFIADRAQVQLAVVNCNTSFHRADTFGRTMMNVLNAVTIGGEKVFNCMFFPTCGVNAFRDVEKITANAMQWIEEPWMEMQTPPDAERRYAWEYVNRRPRAHAAFMEIWQFVDEQTQEMAFPTAVESDAEEEEAVAPPAFPPVPPSTRVAAPTAPTRAPEAAIYMLLPVPPPPARVPPPPPAAKQRPIGARPLVPAQPLYPPASHLKRKRVDSTTPAVDGGNGVPRVGGGGGGSAACASAATGSDEFWTHRMVELPPAQPWETDRQFTVDMWRAVLLEHGVDNLAMQEIFLLAQMGDQGRRAANNVVAKLLKARADHRLIANPSAFMHSSCRAARHQLQDQLR